MVVGSGGMLAEMILVNGGSAGQGSKGRGGVLVHSACRDGCGHDGVGLLCSESSRPNNGRPRSCLTRESPLVPSFHCLDRLRKSCLQREGVRHMLR